MLRRNSKRYNGHTRYRELVDLYMENMHLCKRYFHWFIFDSVLQTLKDEERRSSYDQVHSGDMNKHKQSSRHNEIFYIWYVVLLHVNLNVL